MVGLIDLLEGGRGRPEEPGFHQEGEERLDRRKELDTLPGEDPLEGELEKETDDLLALIERGDLVLAAEEEGVSALTSKKESVQMVWHVN